MTKKILIVGASLGGLVAAGELRSRGYEVEIVEKGRSAGGLYNKVETPFGIQELGMHVLYASPRHHEILCDIFGDDAFDVMYGARVDVGANTNFGALNFGSIYPNLLNHPDQARILAEVVAKREPSDQAGNAMAEAERRFGPLAAGSVIRPILQKLWFADATELSPHALHCFFDLRRIVCCDKIMADELKQDAVLDDVIGNPDQLAPAGTVFEGRLGLTFRDGLPDLSDLVRAWAKKRGIVLRFETGSTVEDAVLLIDGSPLVDCCDAALVTVPVHQLAPPHVFQDTDQLELSIYYFELDGRLGPAFPAYYLLCHDARYRSSRVVNYEAYSSKSRGEAGSVLAVEAIHRIGERPDIADIAGEVQTLFLDFEIKNSYPLKHSLRLCGPTLRNQHVFDQFENTIVSAFASKPLFFTGMRTDTGIFFSHHTIGLAHDKALACDALFRNNH